MVMGSDIVAPCAEWQVLQYEYLIYVLASVNDSVSSSVDSTS